MRFLAVWDGSRWWLVEVGRVRLQGHCAHRVRDRVRARTVTAFLAISAGLISFNCLEFILEALKEDFSMTSSETMVVSLVSSGACLLVVFLVGALADRLGDRLVLMVASAAFCLGASLFAFAQDDAVLLIGQSVSGIGTIAMSIVGLSILNKNFI